MSTSTVLCQSLIFIGRDNPLITTRSSSLKFSLHFTRGRRRRVSGFALNSKKKGKKSSTRKRSWWQNFFFEEEGNWLGLKDDDMIEAEAEAVVEAELSDATGDDEGLSEGEKFEAWKRRAEAIVELREAQEDMLNEESRRWEDWIVDYDGSTNGSWWSQDSDGNGNGNGNGVAIDGVNSDPTDLVPEKGFVEYVRDLVLGKDEEDMLYEDRVFQYASSNSAKFLAVLIIIPLALDFAVHDYVLMPFLDRYVKTVPVAAQILDVRKSQKLEMVKDLKVESARLRFEMEIGKSPPLSDEEVWWELRHKALDLRDEWRLENRRAFANIWSDMIFGISLFILLFFNQSKVALLKFTGYKIVNNVSDTGKAFLIILLTDIFLGYHSESGWQTLLEVIVEHYGLQVDQSAITIFIAVVPVVIDACVKLWLFKFLPRLSPRVANLFQEMTRH